MSIISRGSSRKRPAAAVSKITDIAADPLPQEPAPPPLDPAQVAVRLLMARALELGNTTWEEAGHDGTIVTVLLPSVLWTKVARKEWQARAREGQNPEDGSHGRYWHSMSWLVWAPKEEESSYNLSNAADNFTRAVADGRHCIAFTADLSWIPNDMAKCADHRLVLPLLTAADVSVIALELYGVSPTEVLAEDQAAALTPRLLRLARRPHQTADSYICKLKTLLDLDQVADVKVTRAPSVTIRETPNLQRLHGMSDAVMWGMNLAKDIQGYKDGQLMWSSVDRGLLLSGPPGVGKTLFARALAATCNVPLITGSYGAWLGTGTGHQGNLLKAMRMTFNNAREAAPAILFIDEIDSFPNRATLTHHYADWEIQVVNALLNEIDGVEGRDGVVLVGACNHPRKLDPALVRSGRLDRHITINLPDRQALSAILREHLADELPNENLDSAALAATGSSGADCERFVRGAHRRARNAGRPLTLSDLMDEIGGDDNRDEAELMMAAVHEAGHAISVLDLGVGSLRAVSLFGNEERAGGTSSSNVKSFVTAYDVRCHLIIALSGRAAEEVILGLATSGAGGNSDSDLAKATWLVATSATALGLDEACGLIWTGMPEPNDLVTLFRDQPGVATRVRTVVDDGYREALSLIRRRSSAVKALAAALLDKRVLDGDEATAIAARFPANSIV